MSTSTSTRRLCEGAICVALSLALSYIEIPIGVAFGGFGGSINVVMLPLIIFAMRWGMPWGVGVGFVFGILKYFFANGIALNWVSIFLDYSVAYGFVGFAGLLRGKYKMLPLAALIGCVGRFIIHYISGVTVYAMWMPEEFMGLTMTSPAFYSLLYNGTYMLPNTILAVVLCALLIKPVESLKQPE